MLLGYSSRVTLDNHSCIILASSVLALVPPLSNIQEGANALSVSGAYLAMWFPMKAIVKLSSSSLKASKPLKLAFNERFWLVTSTLNTPQANNQCV